MASLTRWTWVWVNSGSWWWTGRPGMLQFMGSQRVGHDWVTELNWSELLGRKVMINLHSIFKSRDITLPTKVRLVKAIYGFSSSHVRMWELDYKESWAPKNWCFRNVVLEKTLESPLDCKEIQPGLILKEISPGCSLEGLVLKLKLWYFDHLMRRADSFEKTLLLGKIEGGRRRYKRGWNGWMASPSQWTWIWVNSSSWWWTRRPGVLWFMGSQWVGHDRATELNRTELNWTEPYTSTYRQ